MAATSKRRYHPITAEDSAYHDTFDRCRVQSQILNAGNTLPGVRTIIMDKTNLEFIRRTLIGDEQGQYKVEDSTHMAKIPSIEDSIYTIDERFAHICHQCRNEGKEAPTQMPDSLRNQKLALEARLDVALEELGVIEGKLVALNAQKQQQKDSNVLKWGLKCAGHFRGTREKDPRLKNVLKDIDGQEVSLIDGQLVITDKRSPYNGMSVLDYRKLAKIWQTERNATLARKIAEAKSRTRPGEAVILDNISRGTCVSRSSLPPWPDWAKHWSVDGENKKSKQKK